WRRPETPLSGAQGPASHSVDSQSLNPGALDTPAARKAGHPVARHGDRKTSVAFAGDSLPRRGSARVGSWRRAMSSSTVLGSQMLSPPARTGEGSQRAEPSLMRAFWPRAAWLSELALGLMTSRRMARTVTGERSARTTKPLARVQ